LACSQEYVAFWIDWGGGWAYAGTASVPAHDYPIPPGGLKFAVYQPIASSAHRQNCSSGPVQPAVRATLSWAVPPPPANPYWVPVWGNQLDAGRHDRLEQSHRMGGPGNRGRFLHPVNEGPHKR
jgi:hypothetical protein